jgi:glycosyltransferase involved in cell wall biosynthesis
MVSLVIPVYNEIESLPLLYQEIRSAFEPLSHSYEILFVDDGSTDGSGAWLDQCSRQDAHVRAIHLVRNTGQSAAFAAGFERASGEVIVTLDADGQNPPGEIPRLLEAYAGAKVDIVAGYRRRRNDSFWRIVQSRIANSFRNVLTGESIRDTGCSLKLFRRDLLRSLPTFRGMHRFLPTLCRLHGPIRVIEIAVEHRERTRGVSKYGMWNRATRGVADVLGVLWLRSRWIRVEVRDDD